MDIDIVVLWQVEVAFASVKATDQKVLYSLRLQLENNLPHFFYKLPIMYPLICYCCHKIILGDN